MSKKEESIKAKIDAMSADQKVGALLTLGFNGTIITPNVYNYINVFHCGGLRLTPASRTFGNYVDPKTGKSIVTLKGNEYYYKKGGAPEPTGAEYKEVIDGLKAIAASRPLSLPLHFSFDNEGDGDEANCSFSGFSIFPKPMGIRATGDIKYAYESAKIIGRQARSVGMNIIHSPVLDVNSDPRNPEINIRAYSDKAEIVAEWAVEACRGFKDAKVVATAKHFPGRGHSAVDAHYGVPRIEVDAKTMWERELLPYRTLIAKGLLPSIMMAHGIYPAYDEDHLSTVSRKIITGLLREKMGYNGVITTDSMTMGSVATRYGVPEACAMALASGADLVLMKAQNDLVSQTFTAIKRYIEEGKISESELDAKLTRLFSMKQEYGMFDTAAGESPEALARDESIKLVSRDIAEKSVAVLRDRDGALPLAEEEAFLLVEQITTTHNNMHQHAAMMFKETVPCNKAFAFLEVSFTYDDRDKEKIRELVARYDKIVITTFYSRSAPRDIEFIDELIRANPGKKFVVVTNTPYEFSIPSLAGTVICCYAYSPDSLRAAVKLLFGKIKPRGEWPIEDRSK
jgi:beta-N-acetylhexosaminidase